MSLTKLIVESNNQDVAPTHADSFAVIDCIESRGCSEGQEPPQCVDEPGRVVQGCMRDFGQRISAPALLQVLQKSRKIMLQVDRHCRVHSDLKEHMSVVSLSLVVDGVFV